jgi:hypothetical protein
MTKNDIELLSEAYEQINEISSDRLRSAIRNSKETGFEYDRNRRDSILNKAGIKDLRDSSLPIICVKAYGGDKVCKFKIDKSDRYPLYSNNNNESVSFRAFLISTDGNVYKKEIEVNRWNGSLYAFGNTTDYSGSIFFADRSDVNKWLRYIQSVVSSVASKEELQDSVRAAEIVMKNLKPSQFDIRMPKDEKAIEQLKFLRNNGIEESPVEELPDESPQFEEPSIPKQPQKKSFLSRFLNKVN